MTTTDPDALREVIGRCKAWAIGAAVYVDMAEWLAVCDAAARAADAERERDKLEAVLISRHGGEPIALLAELDEARETMMHAERERDEARAHINRLERILTNERLAFPRYFVGSVKDRDAVAADALRATLTDIERLLRAGRHISIDGDAFVVTEIINEKCCVTISRATLPDAVRAAVKELETR